MADKLYYDDAGTTFKEAFAEARKGGDKTFEWNGKSYSTALKSEKKPVLDDGFMESASSVMRRGRAGVDGSGSSPLEKYMDDKATTATRNKRSMDLAVERAKAGVPERRSVVDIATERLGAGKEFKKMAKGGAVKSASSRADGIAQRGKTRGKLC